MVCTNCGMYISIEDEVLCKRCMSQKEAELVKHTDKIKTYHTLRTNEKVNSLWQEHFASVGFPYTEEAPNLPESFKNFVFSYSYLFNYGKGFIFSATKDYRPLIYSLMKSLFFNFFTCTDKSDKAKLVDLFLIRFVRSIEFDSYNLHKDSELINAHLLIVQIDSTCSEHFLDTLLDWRSFSDRPTVFFTSQPFTNITGKIINNPKILKIKGV